MKKYQVFTVVRAQKKKKLLVFHWCIFRFKLLQKTTSNEFS